MFSGRYKTTFIHHAAAPRSEPGPLRVVMVMVVVGGVDGMVVVMMMRGERRVGKHHQQQYGGKNSLHEKNVPRGRLQR
jgi:hypothetical protein